MSSGIGHIVSSQISSNMQKHLKSGSAPYAEYSGNTIRDMKIQQKRIQEEEAQKAKQREEDAKQWEEHKRYMRAIKFSDFVMKFLYYDGDPADYQQDFLNGINTEMPYFLYFKRKKKTEVENGGEGGYIPPDDDGHYSPKSSSDIYYLGTEKLTWCDGYYFPKLFLCGIYFFSKTLWCGVDASKTRIFGKSGDDAGIKINYYPKSNAIGLQIVEEHGKSEKLKGNIYFFEDGTIKYSKFFKRNVDDDYWTNKEFSRFRDYGYWRNDWDEYEFKYAYLQGVAQTSETTVEDAKFHRECLPTLSAIFAGTLKALNNGTRATGTVPSMKSKSKSKTRKKED